MPIIEPCDMSIDSPQGSYDGLRDVLRRLPEPYLLRHYDATPEDYEQLSDEDLKCEYVDGDLIVHSPASPEHEDLTLFVGAFVREFVSRHRLGRAFGSNVVMQLGERRFSPDVSVLKNENAGRVHPARKRIIGPMDLVVEVISASTRDYDFRTKLAAYREGRVGEIWLIDAQRRQFEVHALRGENYETQTLATGRWSSVALAGLVVNVDWFWDTPRPSVGECLGESS
jgi:Uma2 family endonuclease